MKETESRIDLLLQVFQLTSTVHEGISYLSDHPGDKNVLADTQAGLCALRPYFEAEQLDKLNFCLEDLPNRQSDQLCQLAGQFFADS